MGSIRHCIFAFVNSNGKKVLYISYDGMTDTLGQSQVIPYLQGLAALGFCITILSAEKKEKMAAEGKPVGKMLDESGIMWEHISFSSAFSVLSKAYDRSKLLSKAVALQKANKYSIIHCRSYVAAEAGLELKNIFGCKLLFDMRGFWVDERVEGKIWNLKNPAYKLAYDKYKRIETKLIGKADHIICLTHNAEERLVSEWSVEVDRISVIPCAADLRLFHPLDEAKRILARKKLGIAEDTFLLGYLGSFGTWYMLEEMLKFFVILRNKKKRAKFLFLSPGKAEDVLVLAEKLGIRESDLIVKFSSRNEIPNVFGSVDAGVFFIRPTPSKKASSPVKLGEMLAMGIPVICNSGIGDTDALFERNNIGWLLREFTKEQTDRIVDAICNQEHPASSTCRGVAERDFDNRKSILDYAGIYNKLTGE